MLSLCDSSSLERRTWMTTEDDTKWQTRRYNQSNLTKDQGEELGADRLDD